jgi:hypothetical protein
VLPPWRREKRLLLRGPIATLGEAMRALRRGTRCRIIVSNALARFALVPFSTGVDAWRVRVAPARLGEQRLACALDAALLDAIPGAAQAHGVQVSAIEPAWAVGFNAAYRRLPASCWFAVTEPGRLVLGLQIDGEWRQLAAERCGDEPRPALRRALAREATMADDPAAARLPCWVAHFPGPEPTVEALA